MADHHESQLAAELADHITTYTAAFGTGSAERLDHLYEEQGVLVPRPGYPVTGADRLAANRHLLSLGGSIDARARHTYVAGDIALLIVDWTIRGTGPDGRDLALTGAAADVVRRGPDGHWRYVIDNPFGTAT